MQLPPSRMMPYQAVEQLRRFCSTVIVEPPVPRPVCCWVPPQGHPVLGPHCPALGVVLELAAGQAGSVKSIRGPLQQSGTIIGGGVPS